MQFSDPRKLAILESMTNVYDVEEFYDKCSNQGLTVRGTELEYAQKVGMYQLAKFKYQGSSPLEAYMLFVSGAEAKTFGEQSIAGCSGCGGGQVK